MSFLISVLHPTARVTVSEAFPEAWRAAHDAYLRACDHPERVEYLLIVHESRVATLLESEQYQSLPMGRWGDFRLVINCDRDCVVDQLNSALKCLTGLIVHGTQDDMRPPRHWDEKITFAIAAGCFSREELDRFDYQKDQDCNLTAFDGLEANLDRFQIMAVFGTGAPADNDRALMIAGAVTSYRLRRLGYVLDPDFESMFADNFYVWQARKDQETGRLQIVEHLDVTFEHLHPIYGKGVVDDAYARQNREEAYRTGKMMLDQKTTGSRVMIMQLPGEVFRSELAASRFQLIEDTKAYSGYGIVAPHWCHTSNVYATRIELAKAALAWPSCTKDQDLALSCDDDNPLTFPQLQMLIADLAENPWLAGVVGWCWCDHNESEDAEKHRWVMSCGRQDRNDLACMRFTPEDFDKAAARGDYLISSRDVWPQAFWSGLPVLLIRRPALEKMGWRAFVARSADPVLVEALRKVQEYMTPQGLHPHGFARILDEVNAALGWAKVLDSTQNGMTSEDTSFFLRAAELGMDFAVDIRVRVPHMKWRGITPQYVPIAEREQVMANRGDNLA